MSARAGNINVHLVPFPRSLFPIACFPCSPTLEGQSTPSAYSSRAGGEACRRQTAARKEKTFLLSLPHMPTCIGRSEEFISDFQLRRRARWPSFLWGDGESVAFGSPSRKGLGGGRTVFSLGAGVQFAEYTVKRVLQPLQDVGFALPKKTKPQTHRKRESLKSALTFTDLILS